MDLDFVGFAFGVAIIIFASAWAKRLIVVGGQAPQRSSLHQQVASPDRQKALQVYENLCREKLEVIKTALAMGYDREDLVRLDARLESLIGKEQLAQLARGEAPIASGDVLQTDLGEESRRILELRASG